MSQETLARLLVQMESWLEGPAGLPDAEALAAWNRDLSAVAGAPTRSPGWEELVERAHQLAIRVQARAAELAVERDQVREELETHARGNRALKGYGASTR